ncbi:MAG: protein kinase domain-containing protein [Waterburya sp.]
MSEEEQSTAMNMLLKTGDVIKSRYRILDQLGYKGFGRTYLVEDMNRVHKRCILKKFAPQLQGSFVVDKNKELFEKEASVLCRLQHPQIPRFHELFRYQQNNQECLLLVQDYVEGQTYHALLNDRLQEARKFDEAEIEDLLYQILPVLAYIHSMGIIHRDISPDNIMLSSAKQLPMLLDFGSIKYVEHKIQSQLIEVIGNINIPSIGTVIGKSGYVPPEQTEQNIVFADSDLYGLAATAVVLLTGKQPQQFIEPHSYWWNWQEEVIVSPKLTWILSTMLNPHPSDRFRNATEVIKTLQEMSSLTLSPQTTPTAIKKVPRLINFQPQTKIQYLINFIPQLLFFIPFTAVLILGGVLCWEKENLDNHLKPITLIKIQPSDRLCLRQLRNGVA